jgi:hypothetical protein
MYSKEISEVIEIVLYTEVSEDEAFNFIQKRRAK